MRGEVRPRPAFRTRRTIPVTAPPPVRRAGGTVGSGPTHSTPTEHARRPYGDGYRPTPECGPDHDEHHFVEESAFADADASLTMLRALCPRTVDGHPPVRIRDLAYRPALPRRPDDAVLTWEAAESLWLHGPDRDDSAADLAGRADALDRRAGR